MILFCPTILQDHVDKASWESLEVSDHPSPNRLHRYILALKKKFILQCQVITPTINERIQYNTKFGSHKHCFSGNIMVSICHVIFQDSVIHRSCDFIRMSPPGKSPPHQVWYRQTLCYCKQSGLNLSHDLTRPHDYRVI